MCRINTTNEKILSCFRPGEKGKNLLSFRSTPCSILLADTTYSNGGIMKARSVTESLANSFKNSSSKKRVSFARTTVIREMQIILDTSKIGPFLTIDWEPLSTTRCPCRRPTSRGNPHSLSAEDRYNILIQSGCTFEDLMKAAGAKTKQVGSGRSRVKQMSHKTSFTSLFKRTFLCPYRPASAA